MEVCGGFVKEPVIVFDRVSKNFPMYHHVTGIKSFLFNFPKAIKQMKKTRFEALRDISFQVENGETLGIIGRNGAGKSTILGLIAGVLRPTSGRVIVKARISPLLELGAGFHFDLTGRENIVLNGVLMGLTRAEVLARMDEITQFSELGDFIDQPVKTYSSGMLARLGFSIVSSLDPEVLVIDEFLTVGDEGFQEKCLNRMMEFKKRGIEMVFVSHSMKEVKFICDRVAWIENHRVKMIGGTKEVVSAYSPSADK
jgi:lipopolysaccharide transport system ATP-binding protein